MDVLTGNTLVKVDGSKVIGKDALADKDIICIYFSAHWCPPCRQFTPILKDFYLEVQDKKVEIVFVSSDRTADQMQEYMKDFHGDWYAIEHSSSAGQTLKQKFGISGIPALIVLKADGSLITKNGRQSVQTKGPQAVQEWLQ